MCQAIAAVCQNWTPHSFITTSHSRDTLNRLSILHAYVVQRHILVTGPLLAYWLCTIFTFSFSTYLSRSIIVRRCVLTASNKRILYCIVLYCTVFPHFHSFYLPHSTFRIHPYPLAWPTICTVSLWNQQYWCLALQLLHFVLMMPGSYRNKRRERLRTPIPYTHSLMNNLPRLRLQQSCQSPSWIANPSTY